MKFINESIEEIKQEPGVVGMLRQIERCARVTYNSESRMTKDSYTNFVNGLIKSKHYAALEQGTVYLTIPTDEKSPYYDMRHHIIYVLNKSPYAQSYVDGDNFYITTNYRVMVEQFEENAMNYTEIYWSEPTNHPERHCYRLITDRAIAQQCTRHRVFSFMMRSQRHTKFKDSIVCIKPVEFKEVPEDFIKALEPVEKEYYKLLENYKPELARKVLPMCTATVLIMTGFNSDWSKVIDERVNGTTGVPDPDIKALFEPIANVF